MPSLIHSKSAWVKQPTKMKYLNAVFTYNRPIHLKNCVNSFIEYGPEGDLLVVDDGSSMEEQRRYLDELAAAGAPRILVWRRTRSGSAGEQRLGGLYANMQSVYDFAAAEGYDYVFFIQDDQQFMWKNPGFWKSVERIFKHHPETLIVRPVFDKLIFSHDVLNRLAQCEVCQGILFKKSWYAAVGIVRVEQLKAIDWSFRATEGQNNDQSREMGLSMYLMSDPILAFVPSPSTWRFGSQTRGTKGPSRKYFFKPLSDIQISALLERKTIAYLEDYCIPWGWRAWAPYDFSDNMRKYRANLWRWIKGNRFRRLPRWQGVDEE